MGNKRARRWDPTLQPSGLPIERSQSCSSQSVSVVVHDVLSAPSASAGLRNLLAQSVMFQSIAAIPPLYSAVANPIDDMHQGSGRSWAGKAPLSLDVPGWCLCLGHSRSGSAYQGIVLSAIFTVLSTVLSTVTRQSGGSSRLFEPWANAAQPSSQRIRCTSPSHTPVGGLALFCGCEKMPALHTRVSTNNGFRIGTGTIQYRQHPGRGHPNLYPSSMTIVSGRSHGSILCFATPLLSLSVSVCALAVVQSSSKLPVGSGPKSKRERTTTMPNQRVEPARDDEW